MLGLMLSAAAASTSKTMTIDEARRELDRIEKEDAA